MFLPTGSPSCQGSVRKEEQTGFRWLKWNSLEYFRSLEPSQVRQIVCIQLDLGVPGLRVLGPTCLYLKLEELELQPSVMDKGCVVRNPAVDGGNFAGRHDSQCRQTRWDTGESLYMDFSPDNSIVDCNSPATMGPTLLWWLWIPVASS